MASCDLLLADSQGRYPLLVELVVDQDLPVFARFTDGTARQVSSAADLNKALQLLRDGRSPCYKAQAVVSIC